MKDLITSPILLEPNNFTSLRRTPWAGDEIYSIYKKHLVSDSQKKIGESWEFSSDPEMPSIIKGAGIYLKEFISSYTREVLGQIPSCDILLKLISTFEPLSFQVHPHDSYKFLKSDECGKTESWLILNSKPSCGIYLGFSSDISKEDLFHAIKEKQDISSFFNFIEVKEGDYFEILPGVPHAIGGGITLVELQRVIFGKKGKTFRFWDWGRRYDQSGNIDPNGKERELHIEASLEIMKTGITKNFQKRGVKRLIGINEIIEYEKNSFYGLFILKVSNAINLSIEQGYGIIFALGGRATLIGRSHIEIPLVMGETAFLPFSSLPVSIKPLVPSQFIISVPAQANVIWNGEYAS